MVESVLRPRYVESPPTNTQVNYVTDVYTKWRGNYLYCCATYRCPGPNAISPTFEQRFARVEYAGADRFNLACMRQTEQWYTLHVDITLTEVVEAIRDEPQFAI